jgi:hypothetical protein
MTSMDKVLETGVTQSANAGQLAGELAFASPEAQVQRTAELLGASAIVVSVPPLPDPMRGRLAEHVDEHIERALGESGCPSPFLSAWSAMPENPEARIADQLFRARTVGATGIALAMGSLGTHTLAPEDSAFLARLARSTDQVPLVVLLDDADMALDGYGPPVPLTTLLGARTGTHAAPLDARSIKVEVTVSAPPTPEPVAVAIEAFVEPHVDTHVDTVVAPVDVPGDVETAIEAAQLEPELEAEAVADAETEAVADAEPVTSRDEAPAKRDARRRATIGVPVAGPNDFWRGWALALGAAKGPQTLAAFEKLFVESYVPLANAIADGVDDPRAIRAYDEFRRAFERAYTDAFHAFGATNRRPRLVMDAFDVGAKQARLHNARAAHVLVVDSMRYDLGTHVRDALAARSAGAASLTAEMTLFSSLPTTTMRQLETLARGMDALRAPSPDEPYESLRGRSADTVRRLRVGSRELYKLDTVPARIGAIEERVASGEGISGGLEELADHVADAVAKHLTTLHPRTLLLLVGDHGFCVDRRGRVTCGGAAPEEVMVPALAYLVGDLH